MNAEMFFAIAGHNLTIVGTDAEYLKPVVSSHVVMGPSQTMDVPVTANQYFGHYYMAARQYYTDKAIFTEYDRVNVTAILQYSGDYFPPSSPYYPTLPA
ncbi:hypothetical protein SLE2022_329040 [Rubroshorea leprosula]